MGIITIPFYAFFYKYMFFLFFDLGIILYLLFIFTHLYTSFCNPGIPPQKYFLENFNMNQSEMQNYVICKKCRIIISAVLAIIIDTIKE